jgi:hypothetical protein
MKEIKVKISPKTKNCFIFSGLVSGYNEPYAAELAYCNINQGKSAMQFRFEGSVVPDENIDGMKIQVKSKLTVDRYGETSFKVTAWEEL